MKAADVHGVPQYREAGGDETAHRARMPHFSLTPSSALILLNLQTYLLRQASFHSFLPSFHPNFRADLQPIPPVDHTDDHTDMGSSEEVGSSNTNDTVSVVEIPTPKTVAEALELARNSPEGAADLRVREMLETEMARIWAKIEAAPKTYVMTQAEFAVFNYHGSWYVGNELAASARGRYWSFGIA